MHTATQSIGMELEQQRLRRQAARIRCALDAMRRRAGGREVVPAPLRLGMSDFGRELLRVEQQLRELEGHRIPARRNG